MAAAGPGKMTGINKALVAAFVVVKLVQRETAWTDMDDVDERDTELEMNEAEDWARAYHTVRPTSEAGLLVTPPPRPQRSP